MSFTHFIRSFHFSCWFEFSYFGEVSQFGEGQRDDHRLNRKRFRAILLLSGQNDLAIQLAFISKNTSSKQRRLLKNTRMAVTSYQLSPELKKFWHCEKFCHVGRILSRMKKMLPWQKVSCHGLKESFPG